MALELKDLYDIDTKKRTEDNKTFSRFKMLARDILAQRRYKDAILSDDSFNSLPIYWFGPIYRALEAMTAVYPEIRFIDVKNVNYGIRIHHTSSTTNLAALNRIKLDLANEIDELILERVRTYYKRG
jgi:hypothetical protein